MPGACLCVCHSLSRSLHFPVLFGTVYTQPCSLVIKRSWMGLFRVPFHSQALPHPGAELLQQEVVWLYSEVLPCLHLPWACCVQNVGWLVRNEQPQCCLCYNQTPI